MRRRMERCFAQHVNRDNPYVRLLLLGEVSERQVPGPARAVELVHAAAGTSANFTGSPLERCMRDVHVVGQHIMVSPALLEPAGRALLGLPSGTIFF
jgi:hypothetical protein